MAVSSSSLGRNRFDKVQARVGKPPRARYFAAIDERARALLANDPAKLPEPTPESLAPREAPAK